MSLLSDTRHTPQRVYALLRLLDANDGRLGFDNISAWLKPRVRLGNQTALDEDDNIIRQLLGATTSLGMIESVSRNEYQLVGPVPSSIGDFADAVHDRLVAIEGTHADAILLEAFAAMVVLTEKEQGTMWLDLNSKDRAALINSGVRAPESEEDDEEKKRFNSTKSAPWKRWMIFLGLGVPMPKSDFYPYPAQRVLREFARLRADGTIPTVMDADLFIERIAERMPYLDNGRLFLASADRLRLPPLVRSISRVLSGTLRDLHDDKLLALDVIGDAKDTYKLSKEPHPVQNIKAVTLEG